MNVYPPIIPKKYRHWVRITCFLYLCVVALVIIYDIPRSTFSVWNVLAGIYIAFCFFALSIHVLLMAFEQKIFPVLSSLYLASLLGMIMALMTHTYVGAPLLVFSVCLLYATVYSAVRAVRGMWTGEA